MLRISDPAPVLPGLEPSGNRGIRCIRFCLSFPVDGQFDAEAQQPQPNQAFGQDAGVLKP